MKNKGLVTLHSVLGLFAGIFILMLSLSGAVLAFHDELDAFQKPEEFPTFDYQKKLTIDSCYKVVQKRFPYSAISSCNISMNEKEPFTFSIYDTTYQKGEKVLQLFLHPQTGALLKSRGGSDDISGNFMAWLASFHSSFRAGKTGEWLLGFFSIVFVLSIITGIILYRRNIMAVLLFKKTVWRKNNLHQLIGTWSLLFNVMIGITGLWMQRYVFKKEFYQSNNWINTVKASPKPLFNFDSAYSAVQKKHPDFTAYVIYFPQSTSGKTAVYGSNKTNAYIHSKKFADVIALDSTGAIAKTRFINEISSADRYDIINSQLHMGKYGGTGIKIIYALFGLSSALLSITGFLMWRRKRRTKKVNGE
ncbi:PepSY-associated TM helix domain-containing protein [Ferruginibacter profundus]